MSFKDELYEVIKKKALGFSYSEETIECETVRPRPFVYCERENRLYLANGYIMVQKAKKNSEIYALKPKCVKNFVLNNKIINGLKAFKIKGL